MNGQVLNGNEINIDSAFFKTTIETCVQISKCSDKRVLDSKHSAIENFFLSLCEL